MLRLADGRDVDTRTAHVPEVADVADTRPPAPSPAAAAAGSNGSASAGASHDGASSNGTTATPQDGTTQDGTSQDGTSQDGTSHDRHLAGPSGARDGERPGRRHRARRGPLLRPR